MQTTLRKFFWLTTLSVSAAVWAQTPPDAGSLLQQIERDRASALPKRLAPEISAPPQPMKALTGVSVVVRSFGFAGNTLLSAEQLAPVVAPFLNRPLDFTELQAAAAAVAQAYRQAGWVVRAYLPRQEVTEGVVTIQIVEAVFGAVRIEETEPGRMALGIVERIIARQQAAGAALNADAIDRALLLVDDLPGVVAVGSLGEGKENGETDLTLKLTYEPMLAGDVAADNTGSHSTGTERISANLVLRLSHVLSAAELFSANIVHTKGSDYARLGWTLPLGYDGWRAGLSVSRLGYRLVAPEFVALDGHGSSSTLGLEASYPLLRSRLNNVSLSLNLDRKRFDNQSSGATTTHYQVDAFSAAVNASLTDQFGGGGSSSVGLTLVAGKVDLAGSPNAAADAATTRSAGHYTKLRYAASRQQVITNAVSFHAALSGQVANKNLDSSEKFYLGGASGVRAYPTSEGGGTEGQLVNFELRTRLPENFILTGFYDWGHVQVNRYNDFVGGALPGSFSLSGVGLALGWQASSGLNARLTWARRIRSNPNPTSTGNDQDGTLVKNRFWLTAGIPF